jgi:hypothetical protein
MAPGNVTPERNGPNRPYVSGYGLEEQDGSLDPKCPSNNATTSTSSSALEKAQHRQQKHLQQPDLMSNLTHNNATPQPGPGMALDAATFLPATTSTSTGLYNKEPYQQGRCHSCTKSFSSWLHASQRFWFCQHYRPHQQP